MAGMIPRSLLHGSPAPITVAELRDELDTLKQDVCRETQRMLEEQREHFDEHFVHRHLPPKPDLHNHAREQKSRLGGCHEHQLRTTSTGRKALSTTVHIAAAKSWAVAAANQSRSQISESEADEEDEEKEPHPFLKRNPRVNGGKTKRHHHEHELQHRHRKSSWFVDGMTSAEHQHRQDRLTGRLTGFQMVPSDHPCDYRRCSMEAVAAVSTDGPLPVQPVEVPVAETQGGLRELRISASEHSSAKQPLSQRTSRIPVFESDSESIEVDEEEEPWGPKRIVHSRLFEHMVCVMVLLNAVILGVETEAQWQHRRSGNNGVHFAVHIEIAEAIFCIVFMTELFLRLLVDGCEFFKGRDWAWNLYDIIAIGLQVMEQASNICIYFSGVCSNDMHNTSLIKNMNILRVIRITRLIRMVRLLEELRMITASICSSILSLGWTFLLLMMLLYSLALFFTEIVLQNVSHSEHKEEMQYWFGGLGRTFLTMFECIFGGVSWDEVINPLITEISPFLGLIFCSYISFCVLAMMNMATGVFVDNAMRKAQEDKDRNTANRISDLFFNDPVLGEAESITQEQFCSKIDTPEMQDYFKAINVDPSEAKGLYRLLDADDSGSIDAAEMVAGCLRLRGQAKALELSLLMHEVSRMNHRHSVFQARAEKTLSWLVEALEVDIQGKATDGQESECQKVGSADNLNRQGST